MLKSVARRFSGSTSWGLVDQAVASISNFGVMLLTARLLGPSSFGVFTLLFTTLMFTLMLQRSLIGTPHNVIAARLEEESYRNFTRSAAVLQVSLIGIVGLLLAIGAMFARTPGGISPGTLVAMVPFDASLMWLEFARRVLYTEGRFRTSAVNGALLGGLQLPLLLFAFVLGDGRSVTLVLMTLSLASVLTCIHATRSIWESLRGRANRRHLVEIWQFGAWLGGSSFVGGAGNQIHLYAIAAMLSPSVVGVMRAADTVVRPIGVVSNFLESTLPARLSKVYSESGFRALLHRVNTTATSYILLGSLVTIGQSLWGDALTGLLFGDEYQGYRWLPAAYAIVYLVNGLGSILSSGIRSLELGRVLFNVSATATVFSLPISLLLMYRFGIYGAMFGLIMPSLVRLLILGYVATTRLDWKPALTLS